MRRIITLYCSIILLFGVAINSDAAMIWDWEFDTEAGQLVTDGELVGGVATAGTYQLADFSVAESYDSRLLGSLNHGDYQDGSPGTSQLYTFNWDGSQITLWNHEGSNTYDWWVFTSNNLAVHEYWFGWTDTDIFPFEKNDPTEAGLIDKSVSAGGNWIRAQGNVSVVPHAASSPVPVPSTIGLLGLGLLGLAEVSRRKQA